MDTKEKKEFLQNLNALAGHTHRQDLEKITPQKIGEIKSSMGVFDDSGQRFPISCSIDSFEKFGPGVFLMFYFLKHLTIIFGCISLLSFVQFSLLMKSPYYDDYDNIIRMNMLRLTIASLQPESHNIYIAFDCLMTLIFLGWLIWFKQSEQNLVEKCNEIYKLPSYLTTFLSKIPESYSEHQLKEFLEKDGDLHVEEIYTARNFQNTLSHYKSLVTLGHEFREKLELAETEFGLQGNKNRVIQMLDVFFKLKHKYFSISHEEFNTSKFTPNSVFIMFSRISQREFALKKYSRSQFWMKKKFTENIEKFGQINLKPCEIQPDAICWENFGYSKWKYFLRAFLVFAFLSLITCLGIILIFVLEILETAAIGDAYYFSEEYQSSSNCQILQSQNYVSSSDSSCEQFTPNYLQLAFLILLTPAMVFACKKAIMFVLAHSIHFRKFTSEVDRLKSQILTISFFYVIVSAVLHLVLYLKAKNNNRTLALYQLLYPIIDQVFLITKYSPASIHLYNDFSFEWYKQATFLIIIICSISFNISTLWKLITSSLIHRYKLYKAKKQNIVFRVKQRLQGVFLHIEDVYSSAIAIVFFAFIYFSAIPITIIFCFINLFILFWVCKFVFLRYSQKLIRMSHAINSIVIYTMMAAIIVHCIMAPIYFGAPGIGEPPESYSGDKEKGKLLSEINQSKEANKDLSIGERYLYYGGEYFAIVLIVAIYLVGRKFLKKIIVKYIKSKKEKQDEKKKKSKQFFGLYPSYSMHCNHKYSEILKTLYLLNKVEAGRRTCFLDKNIEIFFNEHSSYQGSQQSSISQENQPLFRKIVKVIETEFEVSFIASNFEEKLRNFGFPHEMPKKLQQLYQLDNQLQASEHSTKHNDEFADKIFIGERAEKLGDSEKKQLRAKQQEFAPSHRALSFNIQE